MSQKPAAVSKLCNGLIAIALMLNASLVVHASSSSPLISVTDHPWYKNRVLPALRKFTKHNTRRRVNHFFVEKVDAGTSKDHISPWIYWKEGNELILFEPRVEESPPDELYLSRRQLSLSKDVLPQGFSGMNTSTYMLRFEDAQRMKRQCLAGTAFTITQAGARKHQN